ncbi:MAG: ABC transporter permease [Gammaproteobacteria bacterium]|nr:ABC transporter permease [Gammaproteobacteria bacterium]MCF6363961.1 ABC transporter permease [Gammaproteobacteria bacterium]
MKAGFNVRGFYTLFAKEVRRFLKVTVQTVLTPMVTALLYLLVFGQVLEAHIEVYAGVSYSAFLIPGLMMMSIIQNAFANSSSSIIQSKMTGNLVFVLLAPISSLEFFAAFVLAAVVRGLLVALAVYGVAVLFIDLPLAHPWAIAVFAIIGSATLGALGVIAGIWADKYDQLAGFQNFFILPLSFLSGVFYSIHALPGVWQQISHFNPFFYLIDGFRWGFFGQGDASVVMSLSVSLGFLFVLSGLALYLLFKGYKIRR